MNRDEAAALIRSDAKELLEFGNSNKIRSSIRELKALAKMVQSGELPIPSHRPNCQLPFTHKCGCDSRPGNVRAKHVFELIGRGVTGDAMLAELDVAAEKHYRGVSPSKSRPSIVAIVKEQSCLIDALRANGRPIDDPAKTCWACLAFPAPLDRAHIVPARFGGSVDPSNFLLLCGRCHQEHPDELAIPMQLLWLVSHEFEAERVARALGGVYAMLRSGAIDQERASALVTGRIDDK